MVRFQQKPYISHSFAVEDGDRLYEEWHGVPDVETAHDLLQHGYKVDINDKIITPIFETSGQIKVNTLGIVGYAPHVPNAINGLPLCMRNKRKVEQKNKVVDLYYNTSFSSYRKVEDAKTKGEKMVQIIQEHESKGVRVNLYVVTAGNDNFKDDNCIVITKFKDAKHPLNIGRLYYPLMHMSYLRVHMFRVFNRLLNHDRGLWVIPTEKVEQLLKIDGQKKILI